MPTEHDELRRQCGGRPLEEVIRLREQAASSACVCADCLQPLAPDASVTLTDRLVQRWHFVKAIQVPVCVRCWLIDFARPRFQFRGLKQRGGTQPFYSLVGDDVVRRLRCEACGRPMRVTFPRFAKLPLRLRTCCSACMHKVRARQRDRRVRHKPMACAVCGTMFVPKQSTAKTCSNRCRQKLFRARHRT